MKKILYVVLLLSGFAGKGQNINSAKTMHDYLLTTIGGIENGEHAMDIIRFETGILNLSEGIAYDYVYRKLYKDISYVIGGFVDARLKDISILVQSKNSQGEWETIEKANKNTNDPNLNIGDYETLSFVPKQDDTYRVLIGGKSENEKTARYGLMFCRVIAGSDAPAAGKLTNSNKPQNTFYSVDTRRTCEWDNNKKEFFNCNTQGEKSIFELNSDETIISHTTNTMKSQYYIREKTFENNANTITYVTKSDVGLDRNFVMDEGKNYIHIVMEQDSKVYAVSFHILTTWKE